MASDEHQRRDVTPAESRERFLILRGLILNRIAELAASAALTPPEARELRVLRAIEREWIEEGSPPADRT